MHKAKRYIFLLVSEWISEVRLQF